MKKLLKKSDILKVNYNDAAFLLDIPASKAKTLFVPSEEMSNYKKRKYKVSLKDTLPVDKIEKK